MKVIRYDMKVIRYGPIKAVNQELKSSIEQRKENQRRLN
jgi:hypothetical protein